MKRSGKAGKPAKKETRKRTSTRAVKPVKPVKAVEAVEILAIIRIGEDGTTKRLKRATYAQDTARKTARAAAKQYPNDVVAVLTATELVVRYPADGYLNDDEADAIVNLIYDEADDIKGTRGMKTHVPERLSDGELRVLFGGGFGEKGLARSEKLILEFAEQTQEDLDEDDEDDDLDDENDEDEDEDEDDESDEDEDEDDESDEDESDESDEEKKDYSSLDKDELEGARAFDRAFAAKPHKRR